MPETATGVVEDIDATFVIVGPQLQEVGQQIVNQNNGLPIESMPVITDNIQTAIDRLVAQLYLPGVNRSEIERKIGLLVEAKNSVAEAAAGLMTARQSYANYLGDAAMTELGAGFKF